MTDQLNGLIRVGRGRLEGQLGLEPARFVYNGKKYELYLTYDNTKQMKTDIGLMHKKGLETKPVKLRGYIHGVTGTAYGLYATGKMEYRRK
jgi:hypothetical protein